MSGKEHVRYRHVDPWNAEVLRHAAEGGRRLRLTLPPGLRSGDKVRAFYHLDAEERDAVVLAAEHASRCLDAAEAAARDLRRRERPGRRLSVDLLGRRIPRGPVERGRLAVAAGFPQLRLIRSGTPLGTGVETQRLKGALGVFHQLFAAQAVSGNTHIVGVETGAVAVLGDVVERAAESADGIDPVEHAWPRRLDDRRVAEVVVRGDGALVSATLARERPIETILSGPAASIAFDSKLKRIWRTLFASASKNVRTFASSGTSGPFSTSAAGFAAIFAAGEAAAACAQRTKAPYLSPTLSKPSALTASCISPLTRL